MTQKEHSRFDIRHKETLTLFLREYFELFFPDLSKDIRFETAKFLDKELISLFGEPEKQADDEDRHKITDALILLQIFLKRKPEWILIHWEQQSEKEKDFEKRMFHYFCGIYFRYQKPVFPIAMFTDPEKWKKPVKEKFSLSLKRYPICKFSYRLIKLKHYKAEEFEKRIEENPLAAAYLPLTDYPKKERPAIKAKAIKGVGRIAGGQRQATLFSLIQESIPLNGEEEKQFQELIRNDPVYKEVKMLQSVREVGIEEGIEIGIQKGMEKGMEKGRLIGKILMAQRVIRQAVYSEQELEIKSIDELKRLLAETEMKMS